MSSQPDLFTVAPRFSGATFDPAFDQDRLTTQIGRVYALMCDGRWRTLMEISAAIHGCPESSASAQLRNLRKPRQGGYTVERRTRGDRSCGLWEYKLVMP